MNVAHVVELVDVVEAGSDRRNHGMTLGELGNHRVVLAHAVRAVQPHDRGPVSRAVDLDPAAAEQLDGFTLKHYPLHSAATASGAGLRMCASVSRGHHLSS